MLQLIEQNKDLLDVIVQLLVVVIPVAVSFIIKNYVRASTAEKDVAAIVRISNAAIDFVENLDKRGDLVPGGDSELAGNVRRGAEKLKQAAEWAESELKKNGISITNEDAQRWISSEFQKRMGGVQPVAAIAEATKAAVETIQEMESRKIFQLPPDADRFLYLTGLAADLLVIQLMKEGKAITREEALTWVRGEMLQRLPQIPVSTTSDPLASLATGALEFIEKLKASGPLVVLTGSNGDDIEADLVTAWILTEAAKQRVAVSTNQIAEIVGRVLQQRKALPA